MPKREETIWIIFCRLLGSNPGRLRSKRVQAAKRWISSEINWPNIWRIFSTLALTLGLCQLSWTTGLAPLGKAIHLFVLGKKVVLLAQDTSNQLDLHALGKLYSDWNTGFSTPDKWKWFIGETQIPARKVAVMPWQQDSSQKVVGSNPSANKKLVADEMKSALRQKKFF